MGKFSFSNFFGTEPEEESTNDDTENSELQNRNKVVSMQNKQRMIQSTISVFEPLVYSDSKVIATKLIDNNAVIINFSRADNNSIKRIIDFLNGTVFTIDGSIERISEKVFLFTPHNFAIDGQIKKDLSNRFR